MENNATMEQDQNMAKKASDATPGVSITVKTVLLVLLFFALGVLTVLILQRFQLDFNFEDNVSFQKTYKQVDREMLADLTNGDTEELVLEGEVAGESVEATPVVEPNADGQLEVTETPVTELPN